MVFEERKCRNFDKNQEETDDELRNFYLNLCFLFEFSDTMIFILRLSGQRNIDEIYAKKKIVFFFPLSD